MEEQTLLTSPWRSQRGALPQLVHPVVFTLMQHSAVDGHATLGCVTIARHGDITIRPYGVSNPKPSGPMASMIGSRLLSVTGSTHGLCPSSLPTSDARKVATESLCSGIREPQFRSSERASSANIGTAAHAAEVANEKSLREVPLFRAMDLNLRTTPIVVRVGSYVWLPSMEGPF
jgi:hypothetical protein